MKLIDQVALKAQYTLVLITLRKNRGHKAKTAKDLQIDRKTLYNIIDKYKSSKKLKRKEAALSS